MRSRVDTPTRVQGAFVALLLVAALIFSFSARADAAPQYPVHTNIVATTFWVGEIFNANLADGSQVCSTYDADWAMHWSGVAIGTVPKKADGCAGSPYGGCDGVSSTSKKGAFTCVTEKRTASNGYFPTKAAPQENPFYLDLPFDDVNDPTGLKTRCQVEPWLASWTPAQCRNADLSGMKNQWVQITDNGQTCYGQVEDAGPSSGSKYHDSAYVFGTNDARPLNKKFSGDKSQGAGMDVSPALNGCLGFKELDGDSDHVSWSFVSAADVPAGPWTQVITSSGVTE